MHLLNKGLFVVIALLIASTAPAAAAIWQDVSGIQARGVAPTDVRQFRADDTALRQALGRAPHENSLDRSQQIQLPLPDGSLGTYVIVESPIMEERLAARYPEIKNYRVLDPVDLHPRGRLSISPRGFHGMLSTDAGHVYIDPQNSAGSDIYLARKRSAIPRKPFRCELHGEQEHRDLANWLGPRMRSASRIPGSILEYRIAVAVTLEYYQGQGGTDSLVTAAINTTIDRVNEIYERDLGIRLKLVNDNDELYEKVDSGLASNATTLLSQVNDWIDSRLPGGDGAYDIGHMFYQTNFTGGGLAFLGSVCDDANKAGGVTGLNDPTGDAFDIDYVAHEIGHQFDAEHSFNGTTGICQTGRWAPSAVEPGSGVTIMGYANLCGDENLSKVVVANLPEGATEPTFHAGSIAEIDDFTRNGGSCFRLRATSPSNNRDPSIASIPNERIPANTPFILDGSATDKDSGDTANLIFQWDQMDTGCSTNDNTFGTDNGSNPLFRSYEPRAESWRNFPALGTQLRDLYDKAEVLPCQERKLNFRLTARDGKSGLDHEDTRLTVVKSAGPFEITNLRTAQDIASGSNVSVEWDVANTDQDPINCSAVEIDLLAFPDNTYAEYSVYSLAPNVPNNGSAMVVMPAGTANVARVRVKCRNNVFYALSDANLRITPGGAPLDTDDFTTRFAAFNDIVSGSAPRCRAPVECEDEFATASSSGKGGSAVDIWWLLALAATTVAIRSRRS